MANELNFICYFEEPDPSLISDFFLFFFPDVKTQVIPLLMATLPAIDPNDVRKSMMAFHLLSTFCTIVPLVDCSQASFDEKLYQTFLGVHTGFEAFWPNYISGQMGYLISWKLKIVRTLMANANQQVKKSQVALLANDELSKNFLTICFCSFLTHFMANSHDVFETEHCSRGGHYIMDSAGQLWKA